MPADNVASVDPSRRALALAVFAGAVLRVMAEVGAYLLRQNRDRPVVLLSPDVPGGFPGSIAFMYAAAALIEV